MKKIIVFDMDDTLAESKQQITPEIATLLSRLLKKYFIGIISWWDYPQFQKQVIPFIDWDLTRLVLLPTSGAKMYKYKGVSWEKEYSEDLDETVKKEVINKINIGIETLKYKPEKSWWQLIEDRWTQITYSALWQEAPVEAKKSWDPSWEKRKAIQKFVAWFFPELQINTWWSTSIDITRKWIDKWHWMGKIISLLWFKKEDILFIWDAIYPWWNDYPPMEMWIECIKTSWPEETKKIILNLL